MLQSLLIIGTGSIGKRHIENFQKYFKIIDIAETRADRINDVKKKFNIRMSYFDFRDALKSHNYNAVVIATPPNSHFQIVKECEKKKYISLHRKTTGNGCKRLV